MYKIFGLSYTCLYTGIPNQKEKDYDDMAYKKGIETKEAILRTAKKLFFETGYEATTFRKIGEELGINHNLVTYYFSGKQPLAEQILVDFFIEEDNILSKIFSGKNIDSICYYALKNRLHYKILARNPKVFRFYLEAVTSDFLHNVFLTIPGIWDSYEAIFAQYKLKKRYPKEYYASMETASEVEIIKRFKSEMYEDDVFLYFIESILPVYIGVPEEDIDKAFKKAKEMLKDVDVTGFTF